MTGNARRIATTGVAATAAMALGLAVPAVASAAPMHHSRHLATHRAALTPAQRTLIQALRADRATFRTAVAAAKAAFESDSTVVAAQAALDASFAAAVTQSDFLTAIQTYDSAVAPARATLEAALQAAADARWSADDAAYAAYDNATSPATAAARETYRQAVHTAWVARRSAVQAARDAFRTAIEPALAQYLADQKAANGDETLLEAAEVNFQAAIEPFQMTLKASIAAAVDNYRTALMAAATAYESSTGAGTPPRYPFLNGHGLGYAYAMGDGDDGLGLELGAGFGFGSGFGFGDWED